jgi:hypothetical protein
LPGGTVTNAPCVYRGWRRLRNRAGGLVVHASVALALPRLRSPPASVRRHGERVVIGFGREPILGSTMRCLRSLRGSALGAVRPLDASPIRLKFNRRGRNLTRVGGEVGLQSPCVCRGAMQSIARIVPGRGPGHRPLRVAGEMKEPRPRRPRWFRAGSSARCCQGPHPVPLLEDLWVRPAACAAREVHNSASTRTACVAAS